MKKGLYQVLENLSIFTDEDFEEKRKLLSPSFGLALAFFIPYYLLLIIPTYGLESVLFTGEFFAGSFVFLGLLLSWFLAKFYKSELILGLPALGALGASTYLLFHPEFAEVRPYVWTYAQIFGLVFAIILTGIRFYLGFVVISIVTPLIAVSYIDHLTMREVIERDCIIYFMAFITTYVIYRRGLNTSLHRREKKEADLLRFSSELGTWKWNLINNEVFFDTRYKEIIGYQEHELENTLETWKELVEESDFEIAEAAFQEYLEGKSPHYEVKFRMKHKKGHWVPVIAKGKIVERDSHGRPTLFVGTHFDFSILDQLSKNLENEKLKLMQASKMATLGEMAAGVAHEINNPLAIISNSNELLRRDPEREGRIIETTTTIKGSVERIAKIVKGLRKFCRDGREFDKKNHSLKTIILDSLDISSLNSKGTKVRLIKEKLFDQEVYCDELEVEQILINLFNNALFGALETQDPWIEVSMESSKDLIKVMVRDSGLGISEEIVENLFNPFFTTKPINEGTGLGLSISKGIAEEHKGSLNYQLIDGHTAFVLSLPIS